MIRARESKSAPVGVVGKVLRILEVLDASPTGLQLREIAQQTRVNKSTAYRFLAHLASEGYLLRDDAGAYVVRSEEHTSELQSRLHLVCRLLLEKKKITVRLYCLVQIRL